VAVAGAANAKVVCILLLVFTKASAAARAHWDCGHLLDKGCRHELALILLLVLFITAWTRRGARLCTRNWLEINVQMPRASASFITAVTMGCVHVVFVCIFAGVLGAVIVLDVGLGALVPL